MPRTGASEPRGFNPRTREGATAELNHAELSYAVSIHAPVKVRPIYQIW